MSKYFTSKELERVSSPNMVIDPVALDMLDHARELAGVPFVLSSAYRNKDDNRAKGGAPNSAHLRGCAFDIICSDNLTRFKIVDALLRAGFNRIGIGSTFVHCDNDCNLPAPRIWLY